METIKEKKCKICGFRFTPKFKTTDRFCSFKCATIDAKKKPTKIYSPIKKVSEKRKKERKTYKTDRIKFLYEPRNKICFIDGCNKPSNTIEHRMGRIGYADDWAKQNNIPLYLDVRYWAGCCLEHNIELENNTELSRNYQISKLTSGKKT